MKIERFKIIFKVMIFFNVSVVFSQYFYFSYKDIVGIDTNSYKNISHIFKNSVFTYNNKLNLFKYNDFLIGSVYDNKNIDAKKEYFFSIDTLNKEICVFHELSFTFISKFFVFNNELYLIANRGTDKRKYTTLIKVDLLNRKMKEFIFKKKDVSLIEIKNTTIFKNDWGSVLKTDSSGHMKVLVKHYSTLFNVFKLIFLGGRGWGKTWEVNPLSEERIWYIFDDDLNLLYTEDD